MTDNKRTLKDEDGSSSDWVELQNVGSDTISLQVCNAQQQMACTTFERWMPACSIRMLTPFLLKQGFELTDQQDGSSGWTFPAGVSLAAGQFLVLFASGKDRTNAAAPLHTNFKLSSDDGYLALLDKSGSVACAVQIPG